MHLNLKARGRFVFISAVLSLQILTANIFLPAGVKFKLLA